MPTDSSPPRSDVPPGADWRFALGLLGELEEDGAAAQCWKRSTADLQSRVWFLADNRGFVPADARAQLPEIVAAWYRAGQATATLSAAELRRIARECVQQNGVTAGFTIAAQAARALGASPLAVSPARTPSPAAQELVDAAVEQWLEEISTAPRWLTLPLLGGADALPLDEVHVELLMQPVSQADELAADYRRFDRRDRTQPFALGLSARQVLARAGRQILIIGEPGAGKSTTVKWIVRAIAAGRLPEFDAALALSLGAYADRLREGPCSLLAYFVRTHLTTSQAASVADCEAAAELISGAARGGNRVLLLLDGWDEVAAPLRDQVRDAIVKANQSLVTLITSRPAGIPQRFVAQSHGTAYRFSGLSPRGIHQLAARVFGQCRRPELSAELEALLRQESDLETLVRNPFLNTLICLLFAHTRPGELLELVRAPARLYERITEWIAAQYNGVAGGRAPLTDQHWRVLEALSLDLLVTSPQPRYVFRQVQVEGLAAEQKVSADPVLAARFVQHVGTVGDEHSFLHATLQEYFAARGLAAEFAGEEFAKVIRRLLPSRDYAEVLRFAAGLEQHRSEFWQCLRHWGAEPDRFYQVLCQQARLVASSGAVDGGQRDLGRDLREELWEAIRDPLQQPNLLEQCVAEYVGLDAGDLVRRTIAELDTLPDFSLQYVLQNAPRGAALKQQLYAEVDRRREDFRGWTNPRAVTAAEVAECRQALLAPDNSPERVRNLCWELGNYRDEPSAPRILELLQTRDDLAEDTFENIVFALAAIASRATLDGLIDLLFDENLDADRVWRIQRELREPHVLDPEGRDRILRRIALLPSSDGRVAIGLGALQGLPLLHASELLLDIIQDRAADPAARLAAAQCLESDRSAAVFHRIAQHLPSELEVEVQTALLVAASQCEVADLESAEADWLLQRSQQGSALERRAPLAALIQLARGNDLPWLRRELQRMLHSLLPEVLQQPEHPLAESLWEAADLFAPQTAAELLAALNTPPELDTPQALQHQRRLVSAVAATAAPGAAEWLQQLLDEVLQSTSGEVLERKFSHDDAESLDTQRAMLAQDIARGLADVNAEPLLAYPICCRPVQVALQTWAEAHGHVVYEKHVLNSRGSVIAGTPPAKARQLRDETANRLEGETKTMADEDVKAKQEPSSKLTLALSGGGMRAALYQLGILLFLAQQNRLKDVREIVSVSGGSILAAHLVKHWTRATTDLAGFRSVAAELLVICRSNIRDRISIPWVWSWLLPWSWFSQSYGPTDRLYAQYQRIFKDTTLGDLGDGKLQLAIVATDSIRQERVAFTLSEILRWQIEEGKGHSKPTPILAKGVELALGVTASSCFPPVFPRLHLTYEELGITFNEFKETLDLNDGGVVTNLGIEVLLALRETGWTKDALILIANAERGLAVRPGNSPLDDINAALAALSKKAKEDAEREFGKAAISIAFTDRVDGKESLPFRAETALFGYRTDLDSPRWQEMHALLLHGAMLARQATQGRLATVAPADLKESIAAILAEAKAPPALPIPQEADLLRGRARPLGSVVLHAAAAILLLLTLVFGGGYGIVHWLGGSKPAVANSAYYQHLSGYGNLQDVVDQSLTHLVSATQTDYNQVMLLHRAGHSYELIVVAHEKPKNKPGYRIASFEGLVGMPIRPDMKVKTINVSDVSKVKDYFPAVIETKSELVVPIEFNGRVVGILNSEADKIGHYTPQRQAKVEELAASLGQVLGEISYDAGLADSEMPDIQRETKLAVDKSPPAAPPPSEVAPAKENVAEPRPDEKLREQAVAKLRERIDQTVSNQKFADEESTRKEKKNAVGITNVSGYERWASGQTGRAEIMISQAPMDPIAADVVLPFTGDYDAKNFRGILAEYDKDPIACSGKVKFKVVPAGDKLEVRDITFEDLVPSGAHSASRLTTGAIREQVLGKLTK